MKKFDFSGWATRNNLKCSDGRTILKDAFKGTDGSACLEPPARRAVWHSWACVVRESYRRRVCVLHIQ